MDGVITGKTREPRRIVLHGAKGVGKSTWAAGAPKPIFVQCEDGIADIGADRFPKCLSFNDVLDRYQQLGEKEHGYKTVVTDALDGLETLIHVEVCAAEGVESIEKIGYNKGYDFALPYWKKVLACLDYLRDVRGLHIILIAHSQVTRFADPEQADYDRWVLQLNKKAAPVITQWADEVLFGIYKVFIRTTKDAFGKEKARGVGTGERIIKTTTRPSHEAKNRLNMPDEIPFPKEGGWDVYAQYIEAHHSGKPVQAPAASASATAEPKKGRKAVAS
jgi:hypothetical protein